MLKKLLLFLQFTFIMCFVIVCLLDFILTEITKNQETIINILEIIFASASSFTFSFSICLNVNNNRNNIENSSCVSNLQNNGSGNISTSIINNNNPIELIRAVKEILIPYQEENICKIVDKSCESLKNEINSMPLNKDFILKYLTDSSTISNEDIQDIWVKLLLQENRQSGSVSKRTLDIVKNWYTNEAILFEQVSKIVMKNDRIYNDINSFSLLTISKLQDIGLIKSRESLTETISIPTGKNFIFIEGGFGLMINNTSENTQVLDLQCDILTAEGMEIRNALNLTIDKNTFIEFGYKIKSKFQHNSNIIVSAHEINSINGTNIKYQINDLLL